MSDAILVHLDETGLRRPALPAEPNEPGIQGWIDRMLAFLRRTGYPAVAATQVGLSRRIVAVDLSGTGRSPVVLLNPEVEAISLERTVDLEGCLNFPGMAAPVKRPALVRVRGVARTGQRVCLETEGLLARILQHKLDHLNGSLFLDHLPPARQAALLRRARTQAPACLLEARAGRPAGAV